jgi:hypothetical protein
MIRQQMPLHDPTFLLPRQLVEDGPEPLPNVPEQRLATPLRHDHDVILAIPA